LAAFLFLGRTIEKINQMIFHFWDTPRAIQIGGSEGDWVEFTGSQIKGEYEIEVIPDSLLPLTRVTEKFEARELATVAMGFPIVQASLPTQMQILSILVKAHREIVDEEKFIAELSVSLQQMQAGVGGGSPDTGPQEGAV